MQIAEKQTQSSTDQSIHAHHLFNLGFRIFFLAAAIFAIITMFEWLLILQFQLPLPLQQLSVYQWHAHEMIFGYGFAAIAGFLLTAVRNWTGVATITDKKLMLVFCFWLAARIIFIFGESLLAVAAFFDFLFAISLIIAICQPVIKVKQWKQLALLAKVILLAVANFYFYLVALNIIIIENGLSLSLYAALYLIIALILNMGRRVIPFFIENGVDYPVKLINHQWIDLASLGLMLLFFISEIFFNYPAISAYLALALAFVNALRLYGWYTPGIWKKSLLWSLYLSFVGISLGFLLFAASYFFGLSKYLSIHTFALAVIALITISMMARVSLGHTGRDVSFPDIKIYWSLLFIIFALFFRVLLPIFDQSHYLLYLAFSQSLWIIAFSLFIWVYTPILTQARIDGMPG